MPTNGEPKRRLHHWRGKRACQKCGLVCRKLPTDLRRGNRVMTIWSKQYWLDGQWTSELPPCPVSPERQQPSIGLVIIDDYVTKAPKLDRAKVMAWFASVRPEGFNIIPEMPIPMLLRCPACKARHIDEGEFITKPHHTHACQECGEVWRPAIVNTVGVQFLPGFKNE